MTPEDPMDKQAQDILDDAKRLARPGMVAHEAILHTFIAAALREAMEAERRACANDVCMYCGKRAPGYGPAEGPNEAGNWTHTPKGGGAPLLCHASSIHARARFIEARKE